MAGQGYEEVGVIPAAESFGHGTNGGYTFSYTTHKSIINSLPGTNPSYIYCLPHSWNKPWQVEIIKKWASDLGLTNLRAVKGASMILQCIIPLLIPFLVQTPVLTLLLTPFLVQTMAGGDHKEVGVRPRADQPEGGQGRLSRINCPMNLLFISFLVQTPAKFSLNLFVTPFLVQNTAGG